jgi:hypothetical protein
MEHKTVSNLVYSEQSHYSQGDEKAGTEKVRDFRRA